MSHTIPNSDFTSSFDPTRDYKINIRLSSTNKGEYSTSREPSFISVTHPGLLLKNPSVLSSLNVDDSENCSLDLLNEHGETVSCRGELQDEQEVGAFLEFDEETQEFYLTLIDGQYNFGEARDKDIEQDNFLTEIEASMEEFDKAATSDSYLVREHKRDSSKLSVGTSNLHRNNIKSNSPSCRNKSPNMKSNSNTITSKNKSAEISRTTSKLKTTNISNKTNPSNKSPYTKNVSAVAPAKEEQNKNTKTNKIITPEAPSPQSDSLGCFDLIGIDAKSDVEPDPEPTEEIDFLDFGEEIFENVEETITEKPVKIISPKPLLKRASTEKKTQPNNKKYRSSSSESSSSSSGSSSSGSGSSSSGSSSSSSSSGSSSDSNSDSEPEKKKSNSKVKPAAIKATKSKLNTQPISKPVSQPTSNTTAKKTKDFSDNDFHEIGAEAASVLSDQFDEVDFGFESQSETLKEIDIFKQKSSSEDESSAPIVTTAQPAKELNTSDFSSDNDQRYEKYTINFSDDEDNSFDLI